MEHTVLVTGARLALVKQLHVAFWLMVIKSLL